MKKFTYTILFLLLGVFALQPVFAGNPDRAGEAGAYELLLNPWARTAGLHAMSTSFVRGTEALYLNVAGLSRTNKTEISLGQARVLSSSGLKLNAFAFAQRISKGGVLGVSVGALDFGDIPITTTEQPEGTGGTFSPSFINMAVSYAQMFENKVSVGVTFRVVSEGLPNVTASGIAVDAGVQYVAGKKDNFKFGLSLKNVGSPMKFGGEGLSFQQSSLNTQYAYNLTFDQRASKFEMPSQLNIGTSYDFLFGKKNRLTILGNFTSNSFGRDDVGVGLEYSLNNMFALRGGYKYELKSTGEATSLSSVYTGLAAGVSIEVPLKKGTDTSLGIDYSYMHTVPFDGTHNIAVRIGL